MEFSPQSSPDKGVSENNKDRDIAVFYKQREEIRKELREVVEASNLNDEDKNIFYKSIQDFIDNYIKQHAENPGVFDFGAYDICRHFVLSIPYSSEKNETNEVSNALRDVLYEKFRKPIEGF